MDKPPMQIPENMSGLQPSDKAMGAQTTADQMTWLGGGVEPTPEEQEAYSAFVTSAIQVMTGNKDKKGNIIPDGKRVDAQIAQQLVSNPDNAAEAMGFGVGMIFKGTINAIGDVPDEVIFPGVLEIYSNVVEIAEDAGLAPDQDTINNGFYHALDQVRLAMQEMGRITPEQAAAELEELKAMEASGELAGLVPAQGGQPPAGPQAAPKPAGRGFGAAMGA